MFIFMYLFIHSAVVNICSFSVNSTIRAAECDIGYDDYNEQRETQSEALFLISPLSGSFYCFICSFCLSLSVTLLSLFFINMLNVTHL